MGDQAGMRNLECPTNHVTIERPHVTRKGLPVGGSQAFLPQDSMREVDMRFRAYPCSIVGRDGLYDKRTGAEIQPPSSGLSFSLEPGNPIELR